MDALRPSSACQQANVEILIGFSEESAHVKEPCVICVCTRVHSGPFVPVCSMGRVLPTPVFLCSLPSPPPQDSSPTHSLKAGTFIPPVECRRLEYGSVHIGFLEWNLWALEPERAVAFYTCGRERSGLNINKLFCGKVWVIAPN